jgi:hypothetical protein
MKKQIRSLVFLVLTSILILNFYYLASLGAMVYYNSYNVRKSNIEYDIEKIDISGPEGEWYPLMNKYASKGFSKYAEEDVDLLIMYTYGDFNKGTSTIFDRESQLYNSFYGCYIIENNDNGYFGYDENGNLQIERIALIPKYDFKYLVAGDLGLDKEDFILDYKVESVSESQDGDSLEIKIRTNSIYHSYKTYNANYIQYGIPYIKYDSKDFYPLDIYCRMIIEKVENNTIIVYYIFTPNSELVDRWRKQ